MRLTVVTLRNWRHTNADCRLLGDRMDGVRAVDIGKREAHVLLHRAQAKIFGVQVNDRAQQHGGTLLPELLAAPQALLLHSTPQRAWESSKITDRILGRYRLSKAKKSTLRMASVKLANGNNWKTLFHLCVLILCPHMMLKCNHKASGCEQQKGSNHWTPLTSTSQD